jgi:hypothetical protein
MYTSWNDVLSIDAVRPRLSSIPVLKLRQPYRMDLTVEEGRRQQVAVVETSWWSPVTMSQFPGALPIYETLVGSRWQNRAFGRDVRQYAPWLFQDPSRQEISET